MPKTSIDISKLNIAAVLAALYNNSKPLGLGILHFQPENMTKEQASELLKTTKEFDYLKGRVMKIDLSGNELYTGLYDRDNGQGAAERALRPLLEQTTATE